MANYDDRRPSRTVASPASPCIEVAELERILGTVVQLVEVFSVAELATAVGDRDVVAVALDAPKPEPLR